jgi:hypothetical protein
MANARKGGGTESGKADCQRITFQTVEDCAEHHVNRKMMQAYPDDISVALMLWRTVAQQARHSALRARKRYNVRTVERPGERPGGCRGV